MGWLEGFGFHQFRHSLPSHDWIRTNDLFRVKDATISVSITCKTPAAA
jgi:hypothetical protein